jgi:hypothetical protein
LPAVGSKNQVEGGEVDSIIINKDITMDKVSMQKKRTSWQNENQSKSIFQKNRITKWKGEDCANTARVVPKSVKSQRIGREKLKPYRSPN